MARKAKDDNEDVATVVVENDAPAPISNPDAGVVTDGAVGSMRHGMFAAAYYHGDAPEPEGPVFDPRYP